MSRIVFLITALLCTLIWMAATISGGGALPIKFLAGAMVTAIFWRNYLYELACDRKRHFGAFRDEREAALGFARRGDEIDRLLVAVPRPFHLVGDAMGVTWFGICRVIDLRATISTVRIEAKGGRIRRVVIRPTRDRRWAEVMATLKTPIPPSPDANGRRDWMGRPVERP